MAQDQTIDGSAKLSASQDAPVRRARGAGVVGGRGRAGSSMLVSMMKMLLPAMALALIALVILWPQLLPQDTLMGSGKVSITDIDTSRMANPRFVGVDEQNRPYEIVAREALQQSDAADIVLLDHPQGDITLADNTWLSLSAEAGIWHRLEQVVDLSGGVDLFQDEGHHLSSESARIDIPNGSVRSSSPTLGQGPSGVVEGEGFHLRDRGARIEFTGKAKAVLSAVSTGER